MTTRKTTLSCAGCQSAINTGDPFMSCVKCKLTYELLCANYTEDAYDALSPEIKLSWVCVECRSKIPKGDNSNTPVRQYFMQDSTTRDCHDFSNSSPDNVTVRTGRRYGQSSDNDGMNCPLQTPQLSIVKALREAQVEFEERLTLKISKLFFEHFNSLKIDLLERVNCLSNRVDELQRTINGYATASKVTKKDKPSKNTTVAAKPKINDIDRQTLPARRENRKQQRQNVSTPTSTSTPTAKSDYASAVKSADLVSNDGIGEWTEVRRRKPSLSARVSLPGVLRGSAAPGATLLSAAEKRTYLHLKEICGSDACTVEALKARGNYASFKLAVPPELTDLILSPENWAVDICVKPWRQYFRNFQGKK
ncbi:uncharacterized protein LOC113240589 [Hyposmocoma kahamanoa]|uniref:uncharacterized protein LOC113240589 n=1 Tax=Hyposmocoma kahamanoa TaxID=1477025 RepID=UPI000E6D7928|nr:uncharacterized protein LOC113240589 [Hyposmocoma kahamanoa]